MPNNPFRQSEESSFEQGVSLKKPVKAVSDSAKQQAKAFNDEFLAQLYGPSKSDAGDDKTDPNNLNPQQKQAQAQATQPKQPVRSLGGMSDSGDHAKYAAMQALLAKGDRKGADNVMHHMQYYFDKTVGTLDEQVKKAQQKRNQEAQDKAKKEQEEEEKKRQEMAENEQEVAAPTGKGRNRMGQPPGKKQKVPMAVQMGKNKAEMFRGSSG